VADDEIEQLLVVHAEHDVLARGRGKSVVAPTG
jgi:hypothetical protein